MTESYVTVKNVGVSKGICSALLDLRGYWYLRKIIFIRERVLGVNGAGVVCEMVNTHG